MASISGAVLDAGNGEPIRNSTVTAGTRGSSPSLKTKTDIKGRFRFRDLPPGQYYLSAEHRAYLHQRKQIVVQVATRETIADLELPLSKPGVISGQVIDELGDPMIGARAHARRLGRREGEAAFIGGGSAITDDRGEFRISRLESGRYAVSAEISSGGSSNFVWQPALDDPDGRRLEMSYLRTYYPGVLDAASAGLIDIESGAEAGGVLIRLSPQRTLSIEGMVTGLPVGGSRAPLPLLRKLGEHHSVDMFSPSRVDHRGHFTFEGLSAGRYLLSAQIDDLPHRRIGWRLLELTDRSLSDVILDLVPGTEVHGVLRFEDGLDAEQAQAHVSLSPKGVPHVQRDAVFGPTGGRFTIFGVPGWTYELFAQGNRAGSSGPTYFLSELRVGGNPQQSFDLVVGESPPAEIEIVLARSARISGIVLDESGNPAAGATVLLASDASDWGFTSPSAVTDQRGGFQMQGYLPGDRVLYALDRFDPDVDDPDTLQRLLPGKGEKLEVEKAGEHEVQLQLVTRD